MTMSGVDMVTIHHGHTRHRSTGSHLSTLAGDTGHATVGGIQSTHDMDLSTITVRPGCPRVLSSSMVTTDTIIWSQSSDPTPPTCQCRPQWSMSGRTDQPGGPRAQLTLVNIVTITITIHPSLAILPLLSSILLSPRLWSTTAASPGGSSMTERPRLIHTCHVSTCLVTKDTYLVTSNTMSSSSPTSMTIVSNTVWSVN